MSHALRAEEPLSCEPVISMEGRYFRVSRLVNGRVETYLCETEAEALRFKELLSQPVVEPRGRMPRAVPNAPPRPPRLPAKISLVRSGWVQWKTRE